MPCPTVRNFCGTHLLRVLLPMGIPNTAQWVRFLLYSTKCALGRVVGLFDYIHNLSYSKINWGCVLFHEFNWGSFFTSLTLAPEKTENNNVPKKQLKGRFVDQWKVIRLQSIIYIITAYLGIFYVSHRVPSYRQQIMLGSCTEPIHKSRVPLFFQRGNMSNGTWSVVHNSRLGSRGWWLLCSFSNWNK